MYHQFKELADVDITTEPMEVGPTCHYVMGGVEVDPDTEASRVPGLFAAGEVAGGMHGSNRLGGNSLSDLLVFGRRAGLAAAEHARGDDAAARRTPREALADAARAALAPFDREGGENPYAVQHDLQQTMHDLVGIIRTEAEMQRGARRASPSCGSGSRTSRWRGTGSTTPAGTWPSTCRTCCWSASASPGPRSSGRRAAAGTPATTSPSPTPSGAART